ncbi:MAG: phosphatidylserine decarboxylase [Alcaligenaceae bacterium]|nr:phosphatidylserine decarboxylase [Alcaligenaceae bacterium]
MNKPSYPHPVIAREGWPFLAGIVLVSILVSFWSGWASVPFWLLSLFVLQFFRDPGRMAPDGRLNVLSPADGRIVAVEETRDIYADRQALKISVFMNVFNVHSNRAPVKGIVQKVTYFPGKFLNAALDKASLENERNAMVILTPEGHTVTAVQVAGLVAKRILCYAKPADPLYAGERYGFIRFGSRVDVYLPLDARVRVALGDKVQATSTVLAELPEPAREASDASSPVASDTNVDLAAPGASAPGTPGTAAEAPDTSRSGTVS